MLDRTAVKEFLDEELQDTDIEIPGNISRGALLEAFCRYVEDDYYQWLKDNFNSFFEHGEPDWGLIASRIDTRNRD